MPRDSRYTVSVEPEKDPSLPWLLLVHQLPSEPSAVRVKTWRRLQSVGAVAVKNSVYALPNSAETREDFEWLRAEIVSLGGEAMVFAAQAADDVSSTEIRDALERARQDDWRDLREKCEQALADNAADGRLGEDATASLERQLRSLRTRAAKIDKIDHFRVSGRRDALGALEQLERRIAPRSDERPAPTGREIGRYAGRVWFTRPHPGVDRMASAWLIKRFVDPQARFRFGERIPQTDDVVPFDMFGVELGHRGEQVTFETLVAEFGLTEPTLSRIGRIVRELDLRAESFSDLETATVDRLVEGLRAGFRDDDGVLLEHGMALFEALHCSFSSQAPGKPE